MNKQTRKFIWGFFNLIVSVFAGWVIINRYKSGLVEADKWEGFFIVCAVYGFVYGLFTIVDSIEKD